MDKYVCVKMMAKDPESYRKIVRKLNEQVAPITRTN